MDVLSELKQQQRSIGSVNNLSRNPITVFVSVSIIKLGEREGLEEGYISLCDRLCGEGTVEGLLGNHIHINPLAVTGGRDGEEAAR